MSAPRRLSLEAFQKRFEFIVSDLTPEDAAWVRARLAEVNWQEEPGRWAPIIAIEGAAEGNGTRFARMRDTAEALVEYQRHCDFEAGRAAELAAVKQTLAEHLVEGNAVERRAFSALGLVLNSGLHRSEKGA